MMKRLALLFLAQFAWNTIPPAYGSDVANEMSKQQADELIYSGKFTQVKSKSKIPGPVGEVIELKGMSDIGGPFDAGCTGTSPHSRLVAAAVSKLYTAVLYEKGGRAYSRTFTILELEKGDVKRVYTESVTSSRMSDIRKMLNKLPEN